MNSNIKTFVTQTYETFKRDFWILIGFNIGVSLIINFTLDFHEMIVFLAVTILFFKNLSFVRGASIMPSVSSDFDRFSWKYYMGMPLNKRELILSLMITNLVVMIPLFVWAVSFLPQVLGVFYTDPSVVKITALFKFALLAIAFFLFTSLKSVSQQVVHPRKKYSKISSKTLFLQRLRNFLLILTVGVYSIAGLSWISKEYDLNLSFLFSWIGPTFSFIFETWFIVPTAFGCVIAGFYYLIQTWQTEESGYIKPTWEAKRDSSLTGLCLTALILPFFILDIDTPHEYGKDNELNRAVYLNNEQKVLELLSQGHNVNKATAYGFTPALVAIKEGNFKMLILLEKHGANFASRMTKKDFTLAGMNALHLAVLSKKITVVSKVIAAHPEFLNAKDERGNSPLHLAAKGCNTEIMDHLIQKKSDVNLLNKDGNGPLHLAVSNGCFASVAMLIEAGSDISAKNKQNLLALDLIRSSYKIDNNEVYVLTKKLRAPASQK